jgi:hypothetical protein
VGYWSRSLAELTRFVRLSRLRHTMGMVVDLMKDCHQEPPETRRRLLADAPGPAGDEPWDMFARFAGHPAVREAWSAPRRSAARGLRRLAIAAAAQPRPVGLNSLTRNDMAHLLATVIDQPDTGFGNLLPKKIIEIIAPH